MFEGWYFKTWKWHSINLIPHYTLFSVCEDDPSHDIVGRSLQIAIFGLVINLMWPSTEFKLSRSSGTYGPHWSRRKKRWYKVSRHA